MKQSYFNKIIFVNKLTTTVKFGVPVEHFFFGSGTYAFDEKLRTQRFV